MLDRWYGQPCVSCVQKMSKNYGSSSTDLWRTFKRLKSLNVVFCIQWTEWRNEQVVQNSLWVLCPISGVRHEETLLVLSRGQTDYSTEISGPLALSSCSCHLLSSPWADTHPQTTTMQLCLFHQSVEPLVVGDTFRNAFKLYGGRKATKFALSSAKAALKQRQKCDYQVNLPCIQLPGFEEKHKCIISSFFPSLQKTLYSEGWRHRHWGAGCPRQCLSRISIYSHSGCGKVIVLLKQKKETENKNIKGMVMYLYKIFSDKFSVKVRVDHSDWIEKICLNPWSLGQLDFYSLLHLWVKYWNWKLRVIPFPSYHSQTALLSCVTPWRH